MEITPDIITQFGLMNKISTGHTFVDLLLCLLVPLLLKNVLPKLHDWALQLFTRAPKPTQTFSRTIEYTQRSSYCWWESNDSPSNSILQRAILNYINTYTDTLNSLSEADYQLKKRPWTRTISGDDVDAATGQGGEDEDEDTGREHDYDINVAPPIGVWIDLKKDVRFMRQQESLDDKQKNVKCTYMLESTAKDGNAAIESFVQEALALYKKQESSKHDPSRYMYVPVLSGFNLRTEGEEKSTSAQYKRYKLSDDKTFASFFHPEKDAIVNLVNSFVNKTGKFAIAGYPNKLGFLLYGPPGTGKTSFIKALAQYTKRSIISIPLSKISTNQELVDIMFDQRIQVENSSDSAISLPFSKTIFVMEDVDAASNVVQRRSNVPGAAQTPAMAALAAAAAAAEAEQQQLMAAAAARKRKGAAGRRNSNGSGGSRDGEDQDQDASDKEEGKEASGSSGRNNAKVASDDDDDNEGTSRSKGETTPASNRRSRGAGTYTSTSATATSGGVAFGPSMPAAFGRGSLFRGDDELNLAGLLNVLDGVVDTPNRIIIMTTNHPEKLDPALIRPGRINRKVYMGRMGFKEALAMVRHYFGAVSQGDEAALRRVFVDDVLSPAALEAACAEHDSVDELVGAIAAAIAEQAHGESFKPC